MWNALSQKDTQPSQTCSEGYIFRASPEGRTGVSSYTGEGRHLGGIIGIPWPGSEAGLGVHVAIIRSFFVVCAAIVAAVGAAAGCVFSSFLARKTEKFSAFPPLDHTTPKMTNEHAGSAVAAVLAALKSPLAKKSSAFR